jgi:hypothetical protein
MGLTALKPVVVKLLSNDAGVAAVVGTRIYPNVLPAKTAYPALTST